MHPRRALGRSPRAWGRSRPGSALIEFVVSLPLLVLLAMGCVDFGRFAYTHVAVVNAARAGAANAMMNNFTSSTLGTESTANTWKGNAAQAARDEMNQQMGFSPSDMTVTVNYTTDANNLKRAQVTVGYPFQTIMSWRLFGVGIASPLTLSRTVEMRIIR